MQQLDIFGGATEVSTALAARPAPLAEQGALFGVTPAMTRPDLHTDALPLDTDRPAKVRAPQAIKLTPEQVADNRAVAYAAADRNTAEQRARQVAELATQPVPVNATWVYDSTTGERVGYLTAAGVVPLPTEQPTTEPAQPPAPVVIIPCGLRKTPGVHPAGTKYTGPYHRSARAAADAIAERTGARVLILSARYGLLQLDDLVDDYNLTMGQPGAVTAARVAEQAAALGITDALVTVIAGMRYADVVTAVWPHAIRVLHGALSFGAQRARMGQIVRGEWNPAPSATAAAVPALLTADQVAPPAPELVACTDLRPGDVCAPGSFGPWNTRDTITITAGPVHVGTRSDGAQYDIGYRVDLPGGPGPDCHGALRADAMIHVVRRRHAAA